MMNQNASEKGVLAKYHVFTLAKLTLFIGLLYALYFLYSGMLQLVQLLKTMMVGWAVMLEVLVNSNLLTDVEQLNETIRWLMDMNGDVVPSLFFQ